MSSDAELLRAIADGDRTALGVLYDRHAAWLVVRLSRRCDDPGLVDETVQEPCGSTPSWQSGSR